MPRFASSRFSGRSSSHQESRLASVFASDGCSLIAFRASPVPFLLVFLSPYRCFSTCIGRYHSRNRSVKGVPCCSRPSVQCRRSALRSVLLRVGRGVPPFEAWGGEGGGEFYGTFHVKQGTSLCILRCLPGAVLSITHACRTFPCDGWMRFRAVVMSCRAFRI